MRYSEIINEAKRPSVREQIISDIKRHGPGDYFIRFTDSDKLGFSDRQAFSKTPDVDHPNFDVDYIGKNQGRRAIWFYPLEYYLKQGKDAYASSHPYVWLVKLKPNAWLQTVRRGDNKIETPPKGKERVGIMRLSNPPAAIFFTYGFDIVGKYYNYASQHERHGNVKGPEKPSFFDRVRGYE